MRSQRIAGGVAEQRGAVLVALPLSHEQQPLIEVHILDPKLAALGHAKAATVDERRLSQARPRSAPRSATVSGTLSTTGRRLPRLARATCERSRSSRPSTSRHRNSRAESAWFCELDDTRRFTARWVRKSWTPGV